MQTMQRVQSFRQARTQKGFTIIELVVVILLLGILAATALPRFMDVTDEAHEAVVDGIEGGLVTGAALFRAQWVATGEVPATEVEGFGDGDLFPNLEGYPIGADDELSTGSCVEIYNGLLQSGRPAAAPAVGTAAAPAAMIAPNLGATEYSTAAATPGQIATAAGASNDVVAVTSHSGSFYCKNSGAADPTCVGTGFYDTPADAIASDGTTNADWASQAEAEAALFGTGSCTFYYTGQYRALATGIDIPTLTLNLSDGTVTRGTLDFEP